MEKYKLPTFDLTDLTNKANKTKGKYIFTINEYSNGIRQFGKEATDNTLMFFPIPINEYIHKESKNIIRTFKRNFKANNFDKGSKEKDFLNTFTQTSEFQTSKEYSLTVYTKDYAYIVLTTTFNTLVELKTYINHYYKI